MPSKWGTNREWQGKGEYEIIKWEDSSGEHEGVPTDSQLTNSKAVMVKLTDVNNPENVKVFIVRHPSSFKTLKRVIFDIKLAADRYGIELVHA